LAQLAMGDLRSMGRSDDKILPPYYVRANFVHQTCAFMIFDTCIFAAVAKQT
jgi:hypothetical protein